MFVLLSTEGSLVNKTDLLTLYLSWTYCYKTGTIHLEYVTGFPHEIIFESFLCSYVCHEVQKMSWLKFFDQVYITPVVNPTKTFYTSGQCIIKCCQKKCFIPPLSPFCRLVVVCMMDFDYSPLLLNSYHQVPTAGTCLPLAIQGHTSNWQQLFFESPFNSIRFKSGLIVL